MDLRYGRSCSSRLCNVCLIWGADAAAASEGEGSGGDGDGERGSTRPAAGTIMPPTPLHSSPFRISVAFGGCLALVTLLRLTTSSGSSDGSAFCSRNRLVLLYEWVVVDASQGTAGSGEQPWMQTRLWHFAFTRR